MHRDGVFQSVCIVFLWLLCGVQPTVAGTIVVDPSGGGDFQQIAPAIESAADGDTVLILSGTYDGPLNRDILVELKDLVIRSESGPASAIIDCERQGRGFHVSGADATPILEGLTVCNARVDTCGAGVLCDEGAAPEFVDCVFRDNEARGDWPSGTGGGVYAANHGGVRFVDCEFIANIADCGGGIYLGPGDADIIGCFFQDNYAEVSGGAVLCDEDSAATIRDCLFDQNYGRYGGGLCCERANPHVEATTFFWNRASRGAGILCTTSSPTIVDCDFLTNGASSTGGGIHCAGGSSPIVTSCVFTNNWGVWGGGGVECGVMCRPTFENVTFFWNRAGYPGGAIAVPSPTAAPTFTRCIIAYTQSGGAMNCDAGADPVIRECAVFGNIDSNLLCGDYDDIIYSDILFCDVPDRDVTLCADSPCLPENNPWGVLIGARGQGCGACSTPVQSVSWGVIKAMYREGAAP